MPITTGSAKRASWSRSASTTSHFRWGYGDDGSRDKFGNYFAYKGVAEIRHPTKGRPNPLYDPAEHRSRLINIYDVYLQRLPLQ
jgi:hypothetical protein